jgi:hypothetical protein
MDHIRREVGLQPEFWQHCRQSHAIPAVLPNLSQAQARSQQCWGASALQLFHDERLAKIAEEFWTVRALHAGRILWRVHIEIAVKNLASVEVPIHMGRKHSLDQIVSLSLCPPLVVHLGVDGPNVVLRLHAVYDVFDGHHSGQHRMVLIVVLVHPVAAYQEKVPEAVCVVTDEVEALVTAKISGIRLGNMDDVGVLNILGLEDPDLGHLFDGKSGHFFIGQLPQKAGFIAKIL